MMTVVIDCNIIVMCLTSRSPYYIIYKFLTQGKFNLAINTEILLEYEEIIQKKYGVPAASAFISLLKELPNIHYNISYYKWQLIKNDVDDNKYCDCVIAGEASFLVTEDKHFSVLKNISFPEIKVLSIDNFVNLLEIM
ncbi:MAG: putative toxin-antitoxin system toxin component, PIN family [Ferruginibacter sp.]